MSKRPSARLIPIQVLSTLLVFAMPIVAFGAAWSAKAPTPIPEGCIIAETLGGQIFAGQGSTFGGVSQGRFDRYDPATDTWMLRAMPSDTYCRASGVVGGKLYAFGGVEHGGALARVDVYDPVTDSWEPRSSMPTPRLAPTAAAVDSKIYVLGGTPGGSGGTTANEVYDPLTDTWAILAPMPRPRVKPSAAAVGGKIYVFGGYSDSTIYDVVDVYDPSTDSWSTLATPMPRWLTHAAIAVIDGRILLIGGGNTTEGTLAAVDEYDPVLDHWAAREPMPTPRHSLAAAVVGGIVYAIAGESPNGYVSAVEAYDPTQDATRGPLPFAAFNAKVEIDDDDEFEVKGTFALGAGSNGIDIPTEIVSLELTGGTGAFSATIPAGSFEQDEEGEFKFEGIIAGVSLEVKITSLGNGDFEFKAEGEGADLTGIANPVTVSLTVGDDGGSTTVDAEFE